MGRFSPEVGPAVRLLERPTSSVRRGHLVRDAEEDAKPARPSLPPKGWVHAKKFRRKKLDHQYGRHISEVPRSSLFWEPSDRFEAQQSREKIKQREFLVQQIDDDARES